MRAGLEIGPADRDGLDAVLGWARDEGWNPGLDDVGAFHAADPEGFLLGALDGEPVAAVSVVRHAPDVGFLGLYLCRPAFRGRGHGLALWRAGLARMRGVALGLDGVPAQQANYAREGFAAARRAARWTGALPAIPCAAATPALAGFRDAALRLDAQVNGYARPAFLRAWLTETATRKSLALSGDGELRGLGAIRACAEGFKIGPLIAHTPAEAAALACALVDRAGAAGKPVSVDAPSTNPAAERLMREFGLEPAFETARMWRGPAPAEDAARLYGVGTLELG